MLCLCLRDNFLVVPFILRVPYHKDFRNLRDFRSLLFNAIGLRPCLRYKFHQTKLFPEGLYLTTPRKGRIFISYRRADSAGYAGRIYDRLTAHFGEDAIFMDVDVIPAGVDFVETLQNAVQSCDVLVALIGRSWLNIKDEAGKRRLDNPEDFVRVEIAAALSRDIRVIPVLVDGVPMPRSTELPDNLKPLARRNALDVNHHSFDMDVHRLITQLEPVLKVKVRPNVREQRFYWRQIHLEYRVNANAKEVNNYLVHNYARIAHEITFDNVTYITSKIRAFEPEKDGTLQYGFVVEGSKHIARNKYVEIAGMQITPDPQIESVAELFFITVSQGQEGISILSFDTDYKHVHMFTTGLVQELGRAFTVNLIHQSGHIKDIEEVEIKPLPITEKDGKRYASVIATNKTNFKIREFYGEIVGFRWMGSDDERVNFVNENREPVSVGGGSPAGKVNLDANEGSARFNIVIGDGNKLTVLNQKTTHSLDLTNNFEIDLLFRGDSIKPIRKSYILLCVDRKEGVDNPLIVQFSEVEND